MFYSLSHKIQKILHMKNSQYFGGLVTTRNKQNLKIHRFETRIRQERRFSQKISSRFRSMTSLFSTKANLKLFSEPWKIKVVYVNLQLKQTTCISLKECFLSTELFLSPIFARLILRVHFEVGRELQGRIPSSKKPVST